MRWRSLLPGAFCAAFFAGLLVVCNPESYLFVLLTWVLFLIVSFLHVRRHRAGSARAVLLVQAAVAVAVVSLAAAAPVKTRDRLLGTRMTLPRAEMTLRELQDYAEGAGRRRFPTEIRFSYPESQAGRVVHWPATEMTLRKLLAVIEGQTRLRHQFGSCGNGHTILWGGNCCFGVFLSPPRDPE